MMLSQYFQCFLAKVPARLACRYIRYFINAVGNTEQIRASGFLSDCSDFMNYFIKIALEAQL